MHNNNLYRCKVCDKPLNEWENLDEELCNSHDPSVRGSGDPTPLDFNDDLVSDDMYDLEPDPYIEDYMGTDKED